MNPPKPGKLCFPSLARIENKTIYQMRKLEILVVLLENTPKIIVTIINISYKERNFKLITF